MSPAGILAIAYAACVIYFVREVRAAAHPKPRPEPPVLRPEPLIICTREGRPTEAIYDADPDRRMGLVLRTLERQGARILNSEKRRTS